MQQAQIILSCPTRGQGLYHITADIHRWLAGQAIKDGLLTLFNRHTSASLTIQENADPDVLNDLQAFFKRLVPEEKSLYRHTAEGPDDMPAHIRTALTQTHLSIPVKDGHMMLGTWQGIYMFEHRRSPQTRQIVLHLIGI